MSQLCVILYNIKYNLFSFVSKQIKALYFHILLDIHIYTLTFEYGEACKTSFVVTRVIDFLS